MAAVATAQKSGSRSAAREFSYRARNAEGKIVKGSFDAPNEGAAATRIIGMGLSPVSISEAAVGTGLNRDISIGFLSKGIKSTDLAVATRQLATMTNSGLALLRAVTVVADQTENDKLQSLLHDVARDIETGNSFSDSLAKHREVPLIMVSMLRAGEAGGFLDIALNAVATTFEKEAKLKSTIKSAMTYPIAVLGIAVLAVVAMLLFIVPIFKKMFEGLGKGLPAPTQFLVNISDNMYWLVPTVIVVIVGLTSLWKAKKDTDGVRRVVHPLLLKVPVFGPLVGKIAISRFARNLANMTQAGVPLLRALQIVGQASGNWVIEQTAGRVAESVRLGGSMAEPLSEEKIFPNMVVQMVAVGEESGSIDVMLAKVADFYDDEIEATSAALTSLIEPILICVLGVVVGGMVVALYMPIFSIASAVSGS
jgi:type IV pilus assembly protein PilC